MIWVVSIVLGIIVLLLFAKLVEFFEWMAKSNRNLWIGIGIILLIIAACT